MSTGDSGQDLTGDRGKGRDSGQVGSAKCQCKAVWFVGGSLCSECDELQDEQQDDLSVVEQVCWSSRLRTPSRCTQPSAVTGEVDEEHWAYGGGEEHGAVVGGEQTMS